MVDGLVGSEMCIRDIGNRVPKDDTTQNKNIEIKQIANTES